MGQKLTDLSQGCKENVTFNLLKGGKSFGEVANYNILYVEDEVHFIYSFFYIYKNLFQYGGTNILNALAKYY